MVKAGALLDNELTAKPPGRFTTDCVKYVPGPGLMSYLQTT